jgi:adenylosuccinate synthase
MLKYVDVIVDLQYGDSGKGKISYNLAKTGDYNLCMRVNGSQNAGHTIFHNGKKFVTHMVPCGIFHGIECYIGPGCVLNLDKFIKEVKDLREQGFNKEIYVASNVHLITDEHIAEDSKDEKIGTTKSGVGPCYRDKYSRVGKTLGEYLKETDGVYIKLFDLNIKISGDLKIPDFEKQSIIRDIHCIPSLNLIESKILVEGAQGFYLDIDWGDYPYVTSSHCGVGATVLNGIPPQKIRKVYGVIKPYETYVGAKKFQPDNNYGLEKLQEIGKEFGATTGRKRQCNWLNLSRLYYAIAANGITDLIINKTDVFQDVGYFCYYNMNGELEQQSKLEDFMNVVEALAKSVNSNINVKWSYSPDTI